MKYLMKCGHVANAVDADGKPICALCVLIRDGAREVERELNEHEPIPNRRAKCSLCGKIVVSSWGLPFFGYNPNKDFDEYYCGCCGWD